MEIQIFSNSKFGQLRVALNENGETVFCLADVCKALGIVEPSRVKERLDSSNLHSVKVYTKSSNRHGEFTRITTMTYIGEPNLDTIISRRMNTNALCRVHSTSLAKV